MNSLVPYIPVLVKGAGITVAAWGLTGCASILCGTLFGILSCRYVNAGIIAYLIRTYTFIAKGIPAYVQILIAYFVIPSILHMHVSGFAAACMALVFCSCGYVTEIIRAGINAIHPGQWDACFVLGYPLHSSLKRIILPQVFQNVLPSLFGELEQLLKSTSLLATIGVTELTRTGMNIISRELNPLPVYGAIACVYLLFSAVLYLVIFVVEGRMIYGRRP